MTTKYWEGFASAKDDLQDYSLTTVKAIALRQLETAMRNTTNAQYAHGYAELVLRVIGKA